jgi:gamma-glutamyl:cysteine ligase YbdK (ATP-grasp superfamily)
MSRLSLFQGFGVELEYMIVDAKTLDVMPIADKLLSDYAGEITGDVEVGSLSWSNELVLHVIELKVTEPAKGFDTLGAQFQESVKKVNEILRPHGARLMPTAMHPWMDPLREMKLWPHEYSNVYATFDRLFDCRGHGWANLQSAHLNLPFADDVEFGRLHAAIRLLLPLLPALAASSPCMDGKHCRPLDSRLDVYRSNSAKIPSVAGKVIPEPAFTEDEYERMIYRPMMAEIAPHDPAGVLKKEFLNARGAIARFDRGAIEIRVLDTQECPTADVAIHAAIVAVLQSLVRERWSSSADQRRMPTDELAVILDATIRDASWARITNPDYLELLGLSPSRIDEGITAADIWIDLLYDCRFLDASNPVSLRKPIQTILEHGCLAGRMIRNWDRNRLWRDEAHYVYGVLCDSLAEGEQFGVVARQQWGL